MKPINVLIVEQNILARQALARILRRQPPFNVSGVFGNIEEIESKVRQSNPDAIMLDIESNNGLDILENLKTSFPNCPVIVLSRRTPEGAKMVLSALEAGALDFITKPRIGQNLLFANNHFTKRLIPILKMTSRVHGQPEKSDRKFKNNMKGSEARSVSVSDIKKYNPKVMVIGACTGGPAALTNLIGELPDNLNIPVVIVQHFPKYFTAELAELLDKRSKLKVREAYEGAPLNAGDVYIAPGGYHCEINGWGCKPVLKIHRGPRELNDRPSINNLFRSAANIFGRNVMALILSGHGEDGLEGVKAVKRAGGLVIVQHPDSAVVPDLPNMILNSGFGDFKFVTDELIETLRRMIKVKADDDLTELSGNRKLGYADIARNEISGKSFSLLNN